MGRGRHYAAEGNHIEERQSHMSKRPSHHSHREGGAAAEAYATKHLAEMGYRIVARNQTFRCGELDIVAYEGDVLCFIEVRHRSDDRYGGAIASITPRKQRRLIRAASCYLKKCLHPWPPCRFDVVALDGTPPSWRTLLLRGAFEVTG